MQARLETLLRLQFVEGFEDSLGLGQGSTRLYATVDLGWARAGCSAGLGHGSSAGWKQGTRGRGPAPGHGQHQPTCLRAGVRAIAAATLR